MAFPIFEPNPNKPTRLETPRHLPSLIRFKCAYELPEKYLKENIDPLDGLIQDGKAYCFAGSELWASALEAGDLKVPEEELEEPIINRYEWLQDLFSIFSYVKDSEKRSMARELASCWYYIASHISLDPDDEEGEQIDLITQLLSSMKLEDSLLNNIEQFNQSPQELGTPASLLGTLMNESSENETGTLGNNKSLAQILADSLFINGDEEEDEEDEDYIPEEEEEEDDYYISEDEEDGEDEIDLQVKSFVEKLKNKDQETKTEDNPIETEFRNLVLQTVESLASYLPTKKEWLDRILSASQTLKQEKKLWFPWGLPPMEKIKSSLNSKDEHESKYNLRLVELLSES